MNEAASRYGFQTDRVWAVGYSNGANIAAALMLLHPGVLRGGVLFRAQTPLVPEHVPNLLETDVMIASGRFDQLIPVSEAEKLAGLLMRFGARVMHHWQDTGHGLVEPDFLAAKAWLEARL